MQTGAQIGYVSDNNQHTRHKAWLNQIIKHIISTLSDGTETTPPTRQYDG
jgi:hypothetical protein